QYFLAPMVEITQGEVLGRAEYAYDGRHGIVLNRDLIVRESEGGSRPKIKAYSVKQNAQWVSLWRSLALNRRWYWGLGAALDEETFKVSRLARPACRTGVWPAPLPASTPAGPHCPPKAPTKVKSRGLSAEPPP